MNEHDATEVAYKNGYKDAVKKIRKKLHSEAFAIFDDEGRVDCYAVDLNDIDRVLKETLEENHDKKNH